MRSLFSVLLIALISSVGLANITADQEYVLNHSGYAAQKAGLGTLINKTQGMLVAKYSYAVQGGSTTADISLLTNLGDPKSYAVLPNKAIVQQVFLDTVTAVGGSVANATLAFKAETAGDLHAATATTQFVVGRRAGTPFTSSVGTYIKLTADRTVKMTVGGQSPIFAGKITVFIKYVIGD